MEKDNKETNSGARPKCQCHYVTCLIHVMLNDQNLVNQGPADDPDDQLFSLSVSVKCFPHSSFRACSSVTHLLLDGTC